MTQDEIIEMAREVWLSDYGVQAICRGGEVEMDLETLQSFAKLVADHEREKCAEIAESKRHAPHFVLTSMPSQNGTAVDIANLIKARGKA